MRTAILLVSLMLGLVPAHAQAAKWNVLVYIAADNDLVENADADLEEMAAVGSSPDVNILVQVKRPRLSSFPGTRRYRVQVGEPYGSNLDELDANPDSANPETIGDFINWSYDNFPADRTAIIIWSHGQGWRAPNISNPPAGKSSYKAIIQDDGNATQLYQHDVEQVFRYLQKEGRHPDLIGFDACLMSMLEVWSGLKDFAEVGVASQDLEPGFGWDYRALFEGLYRNPSMDGRQLGILIANSYADFIDKSQSIAIKSELYTISVLDLRKFADFLSHFEKWVTGVSEKQLNHLKTARSRVSAFAHNEEQNWPNGVDVQALLGEYADLTTARMSRGYALFTIETLKRAIIYNRATENSATKPAGLSIYFPENLEVWRGDPEGSAYDPAANPPPPAFVITSGWPGLLKRTLNYRVSPNEPLDEPGVHTEDVVEIGEPPQKKFEICGDGRINEEVAYDRLGEKFGSLTTEDVDMFSITIPLFLLTDDYCAHPTESGVFDEQAIGEWISIVKSSPLPVLFLYATLDFVSHNEDDVPSHREFIRRFIFYLKEKEPDLFRDLKNMFPPSVIVDASSGRSGPLSRLLNSNGDTAFFFEVYSKVFDWVDYRNPLLWISSKYYVAQAYLNVALPVAKNILNARLEFGVAVRNDLGPASPEAVALYRALCREVLARVSHASDKEAKQFGIKCSYTGALLGFLIEDAAETIANSEAFFALHRDSESPEGKLWNWQIRWFHAQALHELGRVKEASEAFKTAYDALLKVDLLPIDRAQYTDLQHMLPTANVIGDPGAPEESAYLFFCQWLTAEQSNGDLIEQLRVIELSRLYDGHSSVVTGLFGSEALVLEQTPTSPSYVRAENLLDLKRRYSKSIEISTFSNVASNTLVYFENAWDNNETIYVKTRAGWERHVAFFSMMEAIDKFTFGRIPDLQGAFEKYLSPVWESLEREKEGARLYIVPHGFARNLPFSAIELGDGKELLDQFTLVYAASLLEPSSASFEPSAPRKMLMIHSTVPAQAGLFDKPLFDGARESEFLRRAAGSSIMVEELSGKAATKRAVMARGFHDFNVLHIVSHSFALASDPVNSGFLLTSEDGTNEEILRLQDIQNWPNRFVLITLSGCNTGTTRPEGAFLEDAASLVSLGVTEWLQVSLWKLSDDAGALISKEFYVRFFSGTSGPEALREAQLVARKAYPTKSKWASVSMIGRIPRSENN